MIASTVALSPEIAIAAPDVTTIPKVEVPDMETLVLNAWQNIDENREAYTVAAVASVALSYPVSYWYYQYEQEQEEKAVRAKKQALAEKKKKAAPKAKKASKAKETRKAAKEKKTSKEGESVVAKTAVKKGPKGDIKESNDLLDRWKAEVRERGSAKKEEKVPTPTPPQPAPAVTPQTIARAADVSMDAYAQAYAAMSRGEIGPSTTKKKPEAPIPSPVVASDEAGSAVPETTSVEASSDFMDAYAQAYAAMSRGEVVSTAMKPEAAAPRDERERMGSAPPATASSISAKANAEMLTQGSTARPPERNSDYYTGMDAYEAQFVQIMAQATTRPATAEASPPPPRDDVTSLRDQQPAAPTSYLESLSGEGRSKRQFPKPWAPR
jgi:hypothetical protein